MFLRLLPYYGSERNFSVLVILCIFVSFHLEAVPETATWECDRTDILKYTVYKVYVYMIGFLCSVSSGRKDNINQKEKGLHPCPNFDSKYPNIRIVDVSQQVKLAFRNVMYEKYIWNLYQRKLTEKDTTSH